MLRDKVQNDIGLAAVLAVAVFAGSVGLARAGAGDDCCADLEERIAELEVTTARKGNRNVSVTVSGWINEAVFRWDDGVQSNAYVGTNAIEQSRFRFVGAAKIDADWSAGYELEIGVAGHPSNQWNQDGEFSSSPNPFNGDNRAIVRRSNWFLKSKTLGKIAIGLDAMATYHLLDNADSTLTRYVDDSEGAPVFLAAFRVRIDGQFVNGLRWVDILRGFNNSTPGDSARRNLIRYDTPEIFGFSAATTWGENDIWDIGLFYKGDIGDFNVQATAGYGRSNDPGITSLSVPSYVVGGTPCISGSTTTTSLPNFLCTWGGAAATILHKPTGLYLYGGRGELSVHTDHVFVPGTVLLPTSTTWFLQPGIENRWLSLGKTALFAEYRHDDPGSNPNRTVDGSINFWQAGVVQNLENADMNLYMVYERADGEVTGNAATAAAGAPVGTSKLDPFQVLVMGAKINF